MAVVRIRPGGRDAYGDPVDVDGYDAETEELTGAFVAPSGSDDIDGRARDGATTALTLFVPAGTDLARTDLVEVDGRRYRIDGDVADWTHPQTGWAPGLTATLVAAEG